MKAPAYYEVHHWPHHGTVLVIDKQAQRELPILTWLQVQAAGLLRADATTQVAYALAAAVAFDVDSAVCVLHDRHGSMLSSPAGLGIPVTVLRRGR